MFRNDPRPRKRAGAWFLDIRCSRCVQAALTFAQAGPGWCCVTVQLLVTMAESLYAPQAPGMSSACAPFLGGYPTLAARPPGLALSTQFNQSNVVLFYSSLNVELPAGILGTGAAAADASSWSGPSPLPPHLSEMLRRAPPRQLRLSGAEPHEPGRRPPCARRSRNLLRRPPLPSRRIAPARKPRHVAPEQAQDRVR
ncbi:hypothetical protein ACU4GD_15615 [Cupriavidus basilensis]